MKKYILSALTAIAAILFSACSNDDITIERKFTISVDASGVPAAFKNIEAGDGINGLNTVTNGYRLRVRVLVYNIEGKLIISKQEYRNDYLEAGSPMIMELENGDYTFVAITDVIQSNGSQEIWTLSEADEINKAMLIYNSEADAKRSGILGVQRKLITITDESQNFTMQPTPAGALLRIIFTGLKSAADKGYQAFMLRTNYTPATVDFKDERLNTTSKQSPVTPAGITRDGLYYSVDASVEESDERMRGSYLFFLPCEVNMRFAYRTQSGTNAWCGPVLTGHLEAGVGYAVTLDLTASAAIDANTKATFDIPAARIKQDAPAKTLRLADIY